MTLFSKTNFKDLTFLIPLRIDTIERLQNIETATKYLLANFDVEIIILLADRQNYLLASNMISSKVNVIYVEDCNPIFHRTKYLNQLTRIAKTQFIAIWDADVLVAPSQLILAINKLREGYAEFVFPYDGRFLDTGIEHRTKFMKSFDIEILNLHSSLMDAPYGHRACGGGFLASKKAYISTGMENEFFFGWGQEDGERVKRWEIFNKRITRITGPMYHLNHPRGVNSNYQSHSNRIEFIKEYLRISKMNEFELKKEVNSWHNL